MQFYDEEAALPPSPSDAINRLQLADAITGQQGNLSETLRGAINILNTGNLAAVNIEDAKEVVRTARELAVGNEEIESLIDDTLLILTTIAARFIEGMFQW